MNKSRQINKFDAGHFRGWTEKRLFSKEGYARVVAAIKKNKSVAEIDALIKLAAKPMFRSNKVWEVLQKLFSVDLKIPYLTGNWTTEAIIHNTIPTRGKQIAVEQIGGTTTAPVTAVALGIGAPTGTALGSEVTTGGGARGAGTVSNVTTTSTDDTEQWVKSFTFTAGFAITEEGLFDNNTSGGNMLASQNFSAINVTSGDILQITHKVQAT